MSNNIYDILKKIENLESPKQALTEGKKSKPDYIDIDKDGDKTEPMKKAAREKSKGAVAEAVRAVETQLSEKYMGFKKTVAAIEKGGSAENPEAVAAAIGRKKYGKEKFQKAAAAGKKLGEGEIEESGLQAYLGKKKYGEEGMRALQQAGREGASKEKMARIRAQHDKMDEGEQGVVEEKQDLSKISTKRLQDFVEKHSGGGVPTLGAGAQLKRVKAELKRREQKSVVDESNYNEDMLSAKEKSFAALAEPKDKITYADKIAGAKKKQKDEGNEFSGELVKARAQGKDSFEVDGKEYPVKEGRKSMREGWEEMQKYLEKKRGPESKGGEGKKAGTRYGGSAQRDDDEETDGEGQPAVKKKGRPKGTGGGAKFSFKKPKD